MSKGSCSSSLSSLSASSMLVVRMVTFSVVDERRYNVMSMEEGALSCCSAEEVGANIGGKVYGVGELESVAGGCWERKVLAGLAEALKASINLSMRSMSGLLASMMDWCSLSAILLTRWSLFAAKVTVRSEALFSWGKSVGACGDVALVSAMVLLVLRK